MEDLDAADGMLNRDALRANQAVSGLLLGAEFFAAGLLGGLHGGGAFGVVALEAGVLEQRAALGEGVALLIGAGLVVLAARLRRPQPEHPPGPILGDDDVLLGVTLLLAGVVLAACLAVLGAADGPVGAVDEEQKLRAGLQQLLQLTGLPHGQLPFVAQGFLDDRRQPVDPLVGLPLAHA